MNTSTIAAVALVSLAASAAAVEPVGPPAAIVQAHSVTNAAEHLTVRVPESATYVGSDRFDLYGIADAEVHVFAQSDANKRLTKLYWIQFEHYWPSMPSMTHNYTGDRRTQHWGTTTWVRTGLGAASEPPRAGSDTEHVRAILERAGYKRPAEMMNVRLVQLLDDPQGTGHGRDELMLIYGEDLAPTGKTLAELTTDGKPNAAWQPLEQPLIDRAVKAFKVVRK
jgi:hypothetical protein